MSTKTQELQFTAFREKMRDLPPATERGKTNPSLARFPNPLDPKGTNPAKYPARYVTVGADHDGVPEQIAHHKRNAHAFKTK
jgi:hypothetical protein